MYHQIFEILLSTIIVVHDVSARCLETLRQNQDYMNCYESYMSYLADAGSGSGGGNQMVQIMCTKEGKNAMKCIYPYYNNCPELAANAQLSILHQVKQFGSVNSLCESVTDCTVIGRCFNESAVTDPPSLSYPNIVELTKLIQKICGPMKSNFICLDGKEDKCPDLKKAMDDILKQHTPEALKEHLNYSTVKVFALPCPKDVNASAIMQCFQEKSKTSTEPSREFYKDILTCAGHDASDPGLQRAIDNLEIYNPFVKSFMVSLHQTTTENGILSVTTPAEESNEKTSDEQKGGTSAVTSDRASGASFVHTFVVPALIITCLVQFCLHLY